MSELARYAEKARAVLALDDPYFDGQPLPDALRDYEHVHSTSGVCVKNTHGPLCDSVSVGGSSDDLAFRTAVTHGGDGSQVGVVDDLQVVHDVSVGRCAHCGDDIELVAPRSRGATPFWRRTSGYFRSFCGGDGYLGHDPDPRTRPGIPTAPDTAPAPDVATDEGRG